jgi:hypothetical protein
MFTIELFFFIIFFPTLEPLVPGSLLHTFPTAKMQGDICHNSIVEHKPFLIVFQCVISTDLLSKLTLFETVEPSKF